MRRDAFLVALCKVSGAIQRVLLRQFYRTGTQQVNNQQILGSCSPSGRSIILRLPKGVRMTTIPG